MHAAAARVMSDEAVLALFFAARARARVALLFATGLSLNYTLMKTTLRY